MNWLKRFFGALSAYFTSNKAAQQAELALSYIGKALPVVSQVAEILTKLTPTGIDDAVWASIKAKYPRLLDGTTKTPQEVRAEALILAAELLKSRHPELSTGTARATVQLAYIDYKESAAKQ